MEEWGASSFVEATIGINLVAGYWKPLVDALQRSSKSNETKFTDRVMSLPQSSALGSPQDVVVKRVHDKALNDCQKILQGFKKRVEGLWKATERMIWASVLLGLITLYFGCENPLTVIFLSPIIIYIFCVYLFGHVTNHRLKKRIKQLEGTAADVFDTEDSQQKTANTVASEIEEESSSDPVNQEK